jgi:hypothetical protein
MPTVVKFVDRNVSKGELAEQNIKGYKIEYDSAIPQMWVNKVCERFSDDQLKEFGNIASHFVFVYDNTGDYRTEYLMPLTKTGCKILGMLALYA